MGIALILNNQGEIAMPIRKGKNQGKYVFTHKPDAERAAASMRRKYKEKFRVYKLSTGRWTIGGVFT